jgi:hypothetical protein
MVLVQIPFWEYLVPAKIGLKISHLRVATSLLTSAKIS